MGQHDEVSSVDGVNILRYTKAWDSISAYVQRARSCD
jgi:hypothetical protein